MADGYLPRDPARPPDADAEAAALAAAERRRRHKRARQSLVFVALFLVVLGIGIGAAGVNQGWWAGPFAVDEEPSAGPSAAACPTPTTVPVDAAGVDVSVLNSTDQQGLAGGVADELRARDVAVGAVANAPEGTTVDGSAQIRFGPEGRRSALGLASITPGAELVQDDQRAGAAVDLVLGASFSGLAPADTPLTATVEPDPASLPAGCASAAPTTGAPTTPAP
ncbi:LytR C-terminal domain-containing protein [Pseudokineococcus basanitobsidens]|uniref:LytR C-terminal domain-containing protein n=1 Tax=Pseudokineococcus basanitobsidens TaxID=1926649 RepID=A0ABU8RK15_9ACTN